MTRRRTRLLVGLAALAAAAVVVGLWPESRPRPCRATFEQVKVGMTQAEVEATVGAPRSEPPRMWLGEPDRSDEAWALCDRGAGQWKADDVLLLVLFGDDGRASEVYLSPPRPGNLPARFARLRARLSL